MPRRSLRAALGKTRVRPAVERGRILLEQRFLELEFVLNSCFFS